MSNLDRDNPFASILKYIKIGGRQNYQSCENRCKRELGSSICYQEGAIGWDTTGIWGVLGT